LANFHKPAGKETQHYDAVSVVALLDDGRRQDVDCDVVAVAKRRSHQQLTHLSVSLKQVR